MTGRDRLVAIVVAAAVLLGGFWFVVLAPKRKQAADISAQVVTQEKRLLKARTSLAQAQDARARYQADYAAVAALGQAVPADDDVPSLIYQVSRAADRERVDFRSLTLDASGAAPPTPAPAAPAPAAPAPEAKDAGSAAPAPAAKDAGSAAPAPASPAPASATAAATLPPGASVGPAGFPTLPFSFEFTGSFFRLEDFLDRLARFTAVRDDGAVAVRGRLLSVDSFDLKAASSGFPKVAASVRSTAYILPPGQGLTAGATADGPAVGGDAPAGGAAPSGGDAKGSAPAVPTAAASLMTGGRR